MDSQIQFVRDTMIRQEDMFKRQVRELHRLYRKQKALMDELERGALPAGGVEGGLTRDFLQILNLQQEAKSLDLEQLPAEDEEEPVHYVPDKATGCPGLLSRDSTLDFREHKHQHRGCSEPSSSIALTQAGSQTLSLFPIPIRGGSSASAFSASPDYTGIRYCQPFNQEMDHKSTMPTSPWFKSFGNGQTVSEYDKLAHCTSSVGLLGTPQAAGMKWQQEQSSYLLDAYTITPPALNGFYLNANQVSDYNDPLKPVWPWPDNKSSLNFPAVVPLFNFNARAEKVADYASAGTSTVQVDDLQKVGIEALGGKAVNDICQGGKSASTLFTNSCADSDGAKVDGVATRRWLDLNRDWNELGGGRIVGDPLIMNKRKNVSDTTTWAATILLSLAPDTQNLPSKLSSVEQESSSLNLLSSDVKLFKSVVIMLKQSGAKASVVKSFGGGIRRPGSPGSNEGAAAALLETLETGGGMHREEKPNESVQLAEDAANGKNKSFSAQPDQPSAKWPWLWGDVTRRKRMQRHRNHLRGPVISC